MRVVTGDIAIAEIVGKYQHNIGDTAFAGSFRFDFSAY
jgi:hypothetical protein